MYVVSLHTESTDSVIGLIMSKKNILQPVYTTVREGRIRSSSTQIDLGGAFTLCRPSDPCTYDLGSKFMISHMPRPYSHETSQVRYTLVTVVKDAHIHRL